jgi:redox-sensitive bicupin YhaK (pirin superfamily)
VLSPGRAATLELEPGRHGWVQVAAGRVTAEAHDRVDLSAGDGLAISDATRVVLAAEEESEMLVFDLD